MTFDDVGRKADQEFELTPDSEGNVQYKSCKHLFMANHVQSSSVFVLDDAHIIQFAEYRVRVLL